MLPNIAEMAVHERGTYVVQRLTEFANANEAADLAAAIFADGPAVAADTKGVFAMIKSLVQLRDKCSISDVASNVANGLCEQLCLQFLNDFDNFKQCTRNPLGAKVLTDAVCLRLPHFGAAMHPQPLGSKGPDRCSVLAPTSLWQCTRNPLGAKVLTDAVCLGLPRFGAVRLGSRIASYAHNFVPKAFGIPIVHELLSMCAWEAGSDECVRDLCCIALFKLHGLLGEKVAANAKMLELLVSALSVCVLDDETVNLHLQQLGQLSHVSNLHVIANEVYNRRALLGDLPDPKYHAPSAIQPDLKYMLLSGRFSMEPPPPPPFDFQETEAPQGGAATSSGGGVALSASLPPPKLPLPQPVPSKGGLPGLALPVPQQVPSSLPVPRPAAGAAARNVGPSPSDEVVQEPANSLFMYDPLTKKTTGLNPNYKPQAASPTSAQPGQQQQGHMVPPPPPPPFKTPAPPFQPATSQPPVHGYTLPQGMGVFGMVQGMGQKQQQGMVQQQQQQRMMMMKHIQSMNLQPQPQSPTQQPTANSPTPNDFQDPCILAISRAEQRSPQQSPSPAPAPQQQQQQQQQRPAIAIPGLPHLAGLHAHYRPLAPNPSGAAPPPPVPQPHYQPSASQAPPSKPPHVSSTPPYPHQNPPMATQAAPPPRPQAAPAPPPQMGPARNMQPPPVMSQAPRYNPGAIAAARTTNPPARSPPPPSNVPVARAPAPHPAARQQQGHSGPWSCRVCTYTHEGPEMEYLSCAVCGAEGGGTR
eukprot:gene24232-9831_t